MRETVDLLETELSGERARAHVAEITRHYRSPGSAGYHWVIDYIADSLSDLGITHTIRTFALDGKTEIGGEPTPLAWEPTSAKLELLPEGEVLVRFDECASCLPWWCRATPPEGVELDVVDVGMGLSDRDYAGKDVREKAVLVHDAQENFAWMDIVRRAAEHGAAGIVSNYLIYQYEPWRTRTSLPDAVQQMRLPARGSNPWTFCVSQSAFERVLAAGSAGDAPARLRFTIEAKTFESTSRSVLATIPGTSPEEEGVLFVAHVSAATMPGANCASGVALALELVQTLTRLISAGRMDQPRRSIHFLFANEGMGSVELAESIPGLLERLLVTFSFCSVGDDQAATKSALIVGRSPDALPTVADDIIERLVERPRRALPWAYRGERREIPYVRWKMLPYTPWSDNVTWSKLGVPSLLFMSLPSRYFHTQFLTVDKTDPRVFVSCGAVTGTAAMVIANAGWPEAGQIMHLVAASAEERLAALALEAIAFGGSTPARVARLADAVGYTAARDIENLRSALRLVPPESRPEADVVVAQLEDRITRRAACAAADIAAAHGDPAHGDDRSAVSAVVPERCAPGERVPHGVPGLTYAEMVELTAEMHARDATVLVESLQVIVDALWSRCDGLADIAAIARSVGHEFDFDLSAEDVYGLARGLERAGYLRLNPAA